MNYDVIIIGAGPGGIYAAYEFIQKNSPYRIAVFETGRALSKRHCPIDGEKITKGEKGTPKRDDADQRGMRALLTPDFLTKSSTSAWSSFGNSLTELWMRSL